MGVPINAYRAYANYVDIVAANKRTADSRKVDLSQVFGYAGSQEYRFGEVPDNVMKLVVANIRRGFSKTRNGIVPFLSNVACETSPSPFRIGWLCRGYMWVPGERRQAHELFDNLIALAGLIDHLKAHAFKLKPTLYDQWAVSYHFGPITNKESVLKEVEKLVIPVMDHGQARRDAVVDWLSTKPTARFLFSSKVED